MKKREREKEKEREREREREGERWGIYISTYKVSEQIKKKKNVNVCILLYNYGTKQQFTKAEK